MILARSVPFFVACFGYQWLIRRAVPFPVRSKKQKNFFLDK